MRNRETAMGCGTELLQQRLLGFPVETDQLRKLFCGQACGLAADFGRRRGFVPEERPGELHVVLGPSPMNRFELLGISKSRYRRYLQALIGAQGPCSMPEVFGAYLAYCLFSLIEDTP